MTPAEVLREAAEVIRSRGLTKRRFGADRLAADTCAVCAIGAIRVTAGGSPWASEDEATWTTKRALAEYLVASRLRVPGDGGFTNSVIAHWNDQHERTAVEVVAAMLAAAARWETEHPDDIPPSKGDGPFLTPLGAI